MQTDEDIMEFRVAQNYLQRPKRAALHGQVDTGEENRRDFDM